MIAIRCRAQLSWRLPPRSRRWRWCLPELASRGATPAWRASCASLGKRSIGPISPSSLAALNGPQPGSSSSPGASRLGSCLRARGRVRAIERVSVLQRPSRSRAIRTWVVCSRRGKLAAEPVEPDGAVERPQRHRAGRVELVQVPAQPLLAATTLGDQVVAVIDQQLQLAQRLLARRVGRPAAAPAAPPWRPRARRSSQTCRASGRAGAAAPSTSAAPAPAARPAQSASVRGRASRAGNPQPPRAAPHRARMPRPAPRRPQDNVRSPTARPSSSTATAVSECLCTSTPITIIQLASKREGATGERTDLNRGQSHAPIRSHSTVSGRRRRHNTGKSAESDIRESSQPPPTRTLKLEPDSTTLKMTLSSGMTAEQYEAAVCRARRTAYRFGDCNSLGRGVFRDEWDTAVTSLASIFSRGSVAR